MAFTPTSPLMMDRRSFLGITAGAGASLALTPELLRALRQSDGTLLQPQAGKLLQRAIPSTGEKLPVIGLGFANHAACADRAALKDVLKTFAANGGKFFDTNHGNAPGAQDIPIALAHELGLQNKLFWSARGIAGSGAPRTPPSPEVVKAEVESVLANFKLPKLDMVMGFPDAEPAHWALLVEAKKQGRIRYLAGMVASFMPLQRFESIMRTDPLDFIGVDYAVDRRGAEDRILPLAMERKLGVMAVFPFGGANGESCVSEKGLFARVANTPLPAWAAEFDAKTWAQFFLKYVISHPAVTVARVGTTKPHHMLDNLGGGVGRLPNEAMRKRMAEFIDALPAIVAPMILDRYVGEYQGASGLTATFRRDGDKLFARLGTNPEALLVARSATRFVHPQGSILQFQLTGQGPATRAVGVTLEQGGQTIMLERK